MKFTLVTLVLALFALTNCQKIDPLIELGEPDFINNLPLGAGSEVTWEVYKGENTVVFEIRSSTTGYVGFGISPNGNMTNADLIMGGIVVDPNDNSTYYFEDYYAAGSGVPASDEEQNWDYIEGNEEDGKTYLKFSRLFDTKDDKGDIAIKDEDTYFIWSQGKSDNVTQYHDTTRGSVRVNILREQKPGEDTTTSTTPKNSASSTIFSAALLIIMLFVVRFSL